MNLFGAFGFGLILGWYVYYVNRYRKGDIQMSDITTLVGAIGGAAVLSLFESKSDLFGAYGAGLAIGFFAYFSVLVVLVARSPNFTADWFLDGRRRDPDPGWGYAQENQPRPPMALPPMTQFHGTNPANVQNFYVGSADVGETPPKAAHAYALALNPKVQRVVDECKVAWPAKKDACNFFVEEVCSKLGVTLSGMANDMVDTIGGGSGWTVLADGPAARDAAMQGKLVIAGQKAQGNGHVAIVVAGTMNPMGWAPSGYWGSVNPEISAKGGQGNWISLCFTNHDMVYACRDF